MLKLNTIIDKREDYVYEIDFKSTKREQNFINSSSYSIWVQNNTIHYRKRDSDQVYRLASRNINCYRYFEKKRILETLDECKIPVIEYFDDDSIFSKKRFFNRHFDKYKLKGNTLILEDTLNRFSDNQIQYIPIYKIICIREQKESEQLLSLINEYSTKELIISCADDILKNVNLNAINSINNHYLNNHASKVFLNEDIEDILHETNNDLFYPFITTDHVNFNQLQSIIHAINNDLTIIQGPPGTGKTTSIINIITSLFAQDKSILFTSNNSDALRNLERKLIDLELPLFYFRIGKPEDIVESIDSFIKTYENNVRVSKVNNRSYQTTLDKMKKDTKNAINVFNQLSEMSKLSSLLKDEDFDDLHININNISDIFNLQEDYLGNIIVTKDLLNRLVSLKSRMELIKNKQNIKIFKKIRINYHYKILFNKYCRNNHKTKLKALYPSLEDKNRFLDQSVDTVKKVIQDLLTYIDYLEYKEKLTNYFNVLNANDLLKVTGDIEEYLNYTTIKDSFMSSSIKYQKFYKEYVNHKYNEAGIDKFYLDIKSLREKYSSNDASTLKTISNYIFENYINTNKIKKIFNLILVTNLSQVNLYKKMHFDYAIIDEASQTRIFNGLLTFQLADSIVLVGDSMQFSPIINQSMSKIFTELNQKFKLSNLYNEKEFSFLEIMEKKSYTQNIFLLEEHYRCDDFIIHFCNQEYYMNRLIPNPYANGSKKNKDSIKLIRINNNALMIDKHANQAEAHEIYNICNSIQNKNSIGIITPYRAQKMLIEKELKGIVPSKHIGTISAFQGQEFENIILSLVGVIDDNGNANNLDFMLNSFKMLNIAVSRAISNLYIVGDIDKIYQYLITNNRTETKLFKLLDYAIKLDEMSVEEANDYISIYDHNVEEADIIPRNQDEISRNTHLISLSKDQAQQINKQIISSKYGLISDIQGKEFINDDSLNNKLFNKIFKHVFYKKINRRLYAVLAISDNLIVQSSEHKLNKVDKEFLEKNEILMNENATIRNLRLKPRQTHSEIGLYNILQHKINNSNQRNKIVIAKNIEVRKVIRLDRVLQYNPELISYANLAHFDYVLYYEVDDYYFPYLIIELDGNEHRDDRKSMIKDIKKNKICNLANIQIIRIPINLKWK